ncbi:hypothetical protein E2C01_076323 [Portunus trituberculatus]|uniref:Uncharacterized protein n=1 Tax=Portunus trituberculatus TaxID=210409 RepID=A0A5B7ID01_PORTR|nr:hypothetical protein [Portunus trituberculatus]
MSKHEWWTLAILAVVAALALAAVVSAVTWIIYNRIASRRRRTNLEGKFCLNKEYEVLAVCRKGEPQLYLSRFTLRFQQKVITDLQSKDKVVLLNSEDSEDEA